MGCLTSRHNLGLILSDLGRLEEAEIELRAVLETMTRVLGPEHPSMLASRRSLALVLPERGQPDEAETERATLPPGPISRPGRE